VLLRPGFFLGFVCLADSSTLLAVDLAVVILCDDLGSNVQFRL
jgi:hypothetical protein